MPISSKTKPGRSSSGFTLLEVTVATGLAVLIISVFLQSLLQSVNLNEVMRDRDIAVCAAQAKIEEIANTDISQVVTNYNGNRYAVAGLTPPVGVANPLLVTASQLGTTNIYNVTITVNWREKNGRVFSYSLNTSLVAR